MRRMRRAWLREEWGMGQVRMAPRLASHAIGPASSHGRLSAWLPGAKGASKGRTDRK